MSASLDNNLAGITVSIALVSRIANPSPADRRARAALGRSRAVQRARAELGRRQENMRAFTGSEYDLAQLAALAASAAPNRTDEAAWPADMSELADKIRRQEYGALGPVEAPVRDKDRQIIKRMLPPGVQVQMNDPRK